MEYLGPSGLEITPAPSLSGKESPTLRKLDFLRAFFLWHCNNLQPGACCRAQVLPQQWEQGREAPSRQHRAAQLAIRSASLLGGKRDTIYP